MARPAAPRRRGAALPKWMQTIDRFSRRRRSRSASLLSGVNPKNLLLTVGAAAAIAQTGIDTGEQAVALAVFILVATLGRAPVASTSCSASAPRTCSTS